MNFIEFLFTYRIIPSSLFYLTTSLLLFLTNAVASLGTSCLYSKNISCMISLFSIFIVVSWGMNNTGMAPAIRLEERSRRVRRGRLHCSRFDTQSRQLWERSNFVRFSASKIGKLTIEFRDKLISSIWSIFDMAKWDMLVMRLQLIFSFRSECNYIVESSPSIELFDIFRDFSSWSYDSINSCTDLSWFLLISNFSRTGIFILGIASWIVLLLNPKTSKAGNWALYKVRTLVNLLWSSLRTSRDSLLIRGNYPSISLLEQSILRMKGRVDNTSLSIDLIKFEDMSRISRLGEFKTAVSVILLWLRLSARKWGKEEFERLLKDVMKLWERSRLRTP